MNYQEMSKNLERYYEIIDKNLALDRYLQKITDYSDFVASNAYLKSELKKLSAKKETLYTNHEDAEQELNTSIDSFIIDLKNFLTEHEVVNQNISDIFKNDIDPMMEGRISTSESRSDFLLRFIYDILNTLQGLGFGQNFSELAHLENDLWHLKIDHTIYKRNKVKEDLEEMVQSEIWGCWSYVSLAVNSNSFIYTKDFKGFGKNVDIENDFLKKFYVEIFHAIRSKNVTEQSKIKTLLGDKLERLHIHLLKKLSEACNAKFWQKGGWRNVLNSNVSSLITGTVVSIITFAIGYFFGRK